jgi:NAD(P)-dependent dehydrogenase (short-subunit alcohol dehydrogenase family)
MIMRILHVGATGTVGTAVGALLRERGHQVISAHRGSVEHPVDLLDPDSIASLYGAVAQDGLDAVVCSAGATPFGPWGELDRAKIKSGLDGKFLGQVELVRRGRQVVRAGGSFTLISGILGRQPIRGGSIAAAANGALEAWARASASELWGQHRINVVSPTVLVESREKYSAAMPGFPAVAAIDVARAYVRSVESMETGQVYEM